MIIIGLTGSMAMGKTTAASMLSRMEGVAVHDSDEAVRTLYQDSAVIDVVKTIFPESFDKKSGSIDKARLRQTLGRDHEKWNVLEDILHPLVQTAQQQFIRHHQTCGTKIVVLDIPLLFETEGERRVDYTICVSAPSFIQTQRINARIKNGLMDADDAAFRLERQMPDSEKVTRADFVVQTGQGLDYTRKSLEKIIKDLKKRHFHHACAMVHCKF